MSLTFDITTTKQHADSITRKIRESIRNKAPLIAFAVIHKVGTIPEVERFRKFLRSDQFFADFGISPTNGLRMANRVDNLFTKASSVLDHAEIKENGGIFTFNLISQTFLRIVTHHRWEPTSFSTSEKPAIDVNAWDIYEWGKISPGLLSGRIPGHKLIEPKSVIQEKLSRSGLGLMIESKGHVFKFGHGSAPRINGIRSAIFANVDKIEKQVAKLMTFFSKTGI